MRHRLPAILSAVLLSLSLATPVAAEGRPRVLATGLDSPWEVLWGPDGALWVTERAAGRVTRIDPDSGARLSSVPIPEVEVRAWQDGLLGLAVDPSGAFAYMGLTYAAPGGALAARIQRMTVDPATGGLSDPVTLIDGLPAGTDHNAGRLRIAPDGMIHYTIGDLGHNQLANWCRPIEAQRLPTEAEIAARDWSAYVGKSLRLRPDGSIPPDNPVIAGVQSHVYTWGHRNPQAMAFGLDGTLYSAEHGPKSDDEVNILRPGGNYGWPHVSGWRDDMAYQYARWADATVPCDTIAFSDIVIHPSVPVTDETAWTDPMVDPILTLFTVPSDFDFQDPACGGIDYICWPTVAPSGAEVHSPAPGVGPWTGASLLLTTLKHGSVYRIPLTADGQAAAGPAERLWHTGNRYRDLAVSPDGRRIFIVTDTDGLHQPPGGGVSDRVENPGALLVVETP